MPLRSSSSSPSALWQSREDEGFLDDKVYGIKFKKNDGWYLGDSRIKFTPQKRIRLAGSQYDLTSGLFSLLTKKNPKEYTENDLENYKKMLSDTGVHLNKSGTLKANKSTKFKNIILRLFSSPKQENGYEEKEKEDYEAAEAAEGGNKRMLGIDSLFAAETRLINENLQSAQREPSTSAAAVCGDDASVKDGEGIHHIPPFEKKKLIKAGETINNCQLIYWNDVNELVERLYLLHMSKQAGNLSVVNEILNIEQELREGDYIY